MKAELSEAAKNLWAKKSRKGREGWLPLPAHLADCAAVARLMWRDWVPEGVKRTIAENLFADTAEGSGNPLSMPAEDRAKALFVFLAAAHDLGKATPVFQAKQSGSMASELDHQLRERQARYGIRLPDNPWRFFSNAAKVPHALATLTLLGRKGLDLGVRAILASHHGRTPSVSEVEKEAEETYQREYHLAAEGRELWTALQDELIDFVLFLSGFEDTRDIPHPNMPSQMLLSGLLIVADWIASNEFYYPYIRVGESADRVISEAISGARSKACWKRLALPKAWQKTEHRSFDVSMFVQRFGFVPFESQAAMAEAAETTLVPGIFVLEAPMGQGKTEAALAAAEILAGKTGRSGIFFALPTQATSDGVFDRILRWASSLSDGEAHSIRLAHGRAQFNETYAGMLEGSTNVGIDEEGAVYVHQWFEGPKKSLLADFVVGTIDQLLLAALRQKHVMLRHAGLAGKVVVIDECHAYDAYMNRYLERALAWLGAYGVPVIMLSATLPSVTRKRLIDAYLSGRREKSTETLPDGQGSFYPRITWTEGTTVRWQPARAEGRKKTVSLERLREENLADCLQEYLIEGGCAGVIVNTVGRSQAIARQLRDRFGRDMVLLIHSRFLATDRSRKESLLRAELGKSDCQTARPAKRIVVGTQVLEQSLDIDFDLLITDLCPMDLLLQRMGRLHRHERDRVSSLHEPRCFVMEAEGDGFESGSRAVYGSYLLMRTRYFLPDKLTLPDDIPLLVGKVYDESKDLPDADAGYRAALEDYRNSIEDKERRAEAFRLKGPEYGRRARLISLMDFPVIDPRETAAQASSEKAGEATVRDTDESIEVLMIRACGSRFYMFDDTEHQYPLTYDLEPEPEIAKALACRRIRLPNVLCRPWNIVETIEQLEASGNIFRVWQNSPWLSGELFLILDENGTGELNGYQLSYCSDDGLKYRKVGDADE